jgi:aminomethyltransferase
MDILLDMETSNLRTPLYAVHLNEGARMVPFAGYDMPVQYASVIAEAKAVREAAGMFDVSHMARLTLTGERVFDFLQQVTTNDIDKLANDAGQYSLLPNERGGIVDDIIVVRRTPEVFDMVVNASNHAKDLSWLQINAEAFHVHIEDKTDDTAMIAVQGPRAVGIVAELAGDSSLSEVPTFGVKETAISGIPVTASRTGYTGEDGFELICAAKDAAAIWTALRNAGVAPCGLASRDTLRVEAGLPLYGPELEEDRSPISAGLGWVISQTKPFVGYETINLIRKEGAKEKLVGVKLETKRLIPQGASVVVNGETVGTVCSGVVSPTLDCGIAFAFVRADVPLNTPAEVDLRGKLEPATIVNKRFLKKPKA